MPAGIHAYYAVCEFFFFFFFFFFFSISPQQIGLDPNVTNMHVKQPLTLPLRSLHFYSRSFHQTLLPPQQFDTRNICIHKLAKLLYLEALRGPLVSVQPSTTTPPQVPNSRPGAGAQAAQFPGFNKGAEVHAGTTDVISFLQGIRPYFQVP